MWISLIPDSQLLMHILAIILLFNLHVIWHLLYDKNSTGDICTLYAAKNLLNATNVPLEPMDDVDASIDFLTEYTKAIVLAAFGELSQTEKHDLNCLKIDQ